MCATYPVWALCIGSIVSSVALVVVNKWVFERGFPYVFTLSTLHFVATSGVLQIMARVFGLFEIKYLPLGLNLLVATFGVGSICLMNFSLKTNSVGFYQVMKLCVVPCCLVINILTYSEWPRHKIVASLVLVLSGVGVATVTDVQLNLAGSLFGIAAVLVTAQYQIWQGKKQKEAGLSSTQLANSVSLMQVFVGGAFALVFEARELRYNMATRAPVKSSDLASLEWLILLSCLLAVSVNVHSFALIGKTSAVTFQVVGHGKTCLILLSGYWLHLQAGKPLRDLYVNLFGVSVALFGVVLYSNLELAGVNGTDWCDHYAPAWLLSRVGGRRYEALPTKA